MPRFVRRSTLAVWLSAVVLIAAAIAMEPAIGQARRHFTKQTINIKIPLAKMDFSQMPSFDAGFEPKSIRFYDQEIETAEKINVSLTRRTPMPSGQHPDGLLHVAYYSDPRHQVAHTPEVCLRQDGGVINALDTTSMEVPGLGPRETTVPVRFVDVQRSRNARLIIFYTFISNGKFYAERDLLRLALGLPGDKYVYFAKVEGAAVCNDAVTEAEAKELAQHILREAIPVLLKDHLPTREEVQGD